MLLLVLLFLSFASAQVSTVVSTQYGAVRGTLNSSDGTVTFLGLRYAQPPLNELRFAAPTSPLIWRGIFSAMEYGPMCLQPIDRSGYTFPANATFDESCLTLNIYTLSSHSNRPVFVWFHGGGLTQGGSNEFRLRGQQLAKLGVVVVTVNYRLGVFGFFASKSFGLNGNFGFLDQQFALRFVRRNIANFGGNPNLITIGGESAGASSVTFHLLSPASQGLFAQAVVQSSASIAESAPLDRVDAMNAQVLNKVNCSNIDCIRALPSNQLLQAQIASSYMTLAVSGGALLPNVREALAKGQVSNVPILAGNTADEGTLFTGVGWYKMTYDDYIKRLTGVAQMYGLPVPSVFADLIAAQYPCNATSAGDCYDAFANVAGDVTLVCPTTDVLHAAKSKTFAYEFNHFPLWAQKSNPHLGAFHSSEIEFVFGTLAIARTVYTPEELVLSNIMSRAWVAFMSTGSAPWAAYSRNDTQRIVFQIPTNNVTQDWKEEQCDFWRFWKVAKK